MGREGQCAAEIAALQARIAELEAGSGEAPRRPGARAWAPKLEVGPELLEEMLSEVSDYLWSAEVQPDGSFEYRYYSPVVEKITGRPPSFYLEGGWLSTIHPEDVERLTSLAAGLVRREYDQVEARYRIIRVDGEVRWMHDRVVAVAQSEVMVLHGVVRDVTEQVLAERKAEDMAAALRRAQRVESLGVLAGGIAHDFNNQLVTVIGSIDLAQLKLASARSATTELDRAQAAAARCAELCRQLLAYSGKGQFTVAPLDLLELVEESRSLLEATLAHPIHVHSELADATVVGDGMRLRQVLTNLVINASEAMAEDEGCVEIRVERVEVDAAELERAHGGAALEPGSHLCLEVADTGCGMSPETLERSFEPFFSTKLAGRGLGLAAVAGVVRGHHGAIWVETEPGAGTRVRLVFPPAAAREPSS